MKILKLFTPLLILSLTACANSSSEDKIRVYTSFFVMEDLVNKIGGDYVEAYSIVPTGREIHGYEPTTGDIVNLTHADMFVYNGAGLEHFVHELEDAIDNPNLVYVEASHGLNLISTEEGDDPHTWLSPVNAKQEMANIKDALISLDPDHANYYSSRFDVFATKFDELHDQYSALLAPGAGKYLVTAHAAFGYLAREYDLLALPIGGHDAEEEPSQQDIANVINIVNQNNIRYVYAETLTADDAVMTVVNETEAELAILNPLEGLTSEEIMAGYDYLSVMKDNLIAIARGYI